MASHMRTKEELLARATQPTEDALRLHPFYKGKVQIMPKCPIRDLADFSVWYTPGVAAPCRAIKEQRTSPSRNASASWTHSGRK